MKKFFKNTTESYTRKSYYAKEAFYLYGSELIKEDDLIAFEQEHNKIIIYSKGVDKEVLEMLIDNGYIRIEETPTLMFIDEKELNESKLETLEMGGWNEIHYMK